MVEEFYIGTAPTVPVRSLNLRQLDNIINKVLRSTLQNFTSNVTPDEIRQLCETAIVNLRERPVLVEIQPPVIVCGDIHGQYADLKRIFADVGHPPSRKFVFLGDMVDRGPQSLETIVLLLCYNARYPDRFVLLRGNHECSTVNRIYGFYGEIVRRYGQQNAQQMWMLFNQTFAWLPYTALIGSRILCMHGGISSRLVNRQQLRDLRRPLLDPTDPSLEQDILWADPAPGLQGERPSPRMTSVQFGENVVTTINNRLGIDLIVRAHQCVPNGAEFFANRQLLTIFSAPGYAGQNTGATLTVSDTFRCSFNFFPPRPAAG